MAIFWFRTGCNGPKRHKPMGPGQTSLMWAVFRVVEILDGSNEPP